MTWLAALIAVVLVAGCGGGDVSAVEREDFILELEVPLVSELDEPEVYGQAGLSAVGAERTRVVIRLDSPYEDEYVAEVRRGGCSSYRGISPDYEVGDVQDGKLDAEVDARLGELREGGYALVVREPRKEGEAESRRRRRFDRPVEKGTCGDLSAAEPTEG